MKKELKEYYCLNDYIMECPELKGEAAFFKGKKYLFNNEMIAKSELFGEHDLSDEIDFDKHFILQSEWDLLQQKSVEIPKQQLRTEAEKRNLVYAKNINNDYNLTGLVEIKKGNVLPTVYCYCTEEVAKEILDFHAQQSKERDMFTIGFHRWLKENCKRTMYLFEYRYKGVKYNDEQLLEIYKSTLTK